jgi:hypothetical protein
MFRLASRRWLVGGSQHWGVLAALSGGMILWRKITKQEPEVLHREVLQPGTTLIISRPVEPT